MLCFIVMVKVTAVVSVLAKAPPNLPPGVPLLNPHMFQAAGGIPPYFTVSLLFPFLDYTDKPVTLLFVGF